MSSTDPDIRLEIDTTEETDSAYGDELSAYTTSVTSSVVDYQEEHGRRYHAYRQGAYLGPNDETEKERLDVHHALVKTLLDGKLASAPLDNSIQRVLDMATGTGIWAIEFADLFPSAEVIGNDLSPMQPSLVPPNVKFLVDDIEAEWGYENSPFDYIHGRYLACAIKDIPGVLSQAYKCLKPGGWVELQDWDPTVYSADSTTKGGQIERYYNEILNAFGKLGYVKLPGRQLEQWMKDAGFVNVRAEKHIVPLGTWPKDKKYKAVGAWNYLQFQDGLEAGALAVLTRFEGWKPEEVRVLIAKALEEAKNRKIHAQFDFYVVYGQRPEA